MLNPMFSIIVPVYNCDQYLNQCIDSVLNQTCDDWELILINDGSTDRSKSICEYYGYFDKITMISQENKGVSAARNVGIDLSEGDYIVFLDSDDWLEPTYLEDVKVAHECNHADCFAIDFKTHRETDNANTVLCEDIDSEQLINSDVGVVFEHFHQLRLLNTVWRFCVKRYVITSNMLLFIEGMIHEDEVFVPQVLVKCNSFNHIKKPLYNYRLRKNSITTS